MIRLGVVLALVAGTTYAVAAEPQIELEGGVVRVRRAAALATLEVFVEGPAGLPPLLGVLRREGDVLFFTPRFDLQPGLRYRAVYREPNGAQAAQILEIPAPPASPATRLERIDPSPDVLPENLLKFYLHFSAPMTRGEAYRRIHLLDAQGRAVEMPFLELEQELWDRDLRRLTLLFDPGRVKRDLLPNQEVGTPLHDGGAYTLVVDRDWQDAQGKALAGEARKTFRVGPADHEPPRVSDWQLSRPRAGTRDPLVARFAEALDRALLESVLEVRDSSGAPVPGVITVEAGETRWRFTPREPWSAGGYSLRTAMILEDLAGNSLGRRFEVDVFERVDDRVLNVGESLPFKVE
jgi:hypothetical protein